MATAGCPLPHRCCMQHSSSVMAEAAHCECLWLHPVVAPSSHSVEACRRVTWTGATRGRTASLGSRHTTRTTIRCTGSEIHVSTHAPFPLLQRSSSCITHSKSQLPHWERRPPSSVQLTRAAPFLFLSHTRDTTHLHPTPVSSSFKAHISSRSLTPRPSTPPSSPSPALHGHGAVLQRDAGLLHGRPGDGGAQLPVQLARLSLHHLP